MRLTKPSRRETFNPGSPFRFVVSLTSMEGGRASPTREGRAAREQKRREPNHHRDQPHQTTDHIFPPRRKQKHGKIPGFGFMARRTDDRGRNPQPSQRLPLSPSLTNRLPLRLSLH